MKYSYRNFLILFLLFSSSPQVAFAFWWDPFSWFQRSSISNQTVSTRTVYDFQNAISKPVSKKVSTKLMMAAPKNPSIFPKTRATSLTVKKVVSVTLLQPQSKTFIPPDETKISADRNVIKPEPEKLQEQTPSTIQSQSFTLPNGAVIDSNGNIIKPALQKQPLTQEVQPQSLQVQTQTNVENSQCNSQIQQMQEQIFQLRQKAIAMEGSYLTGGLTLPVAQGRAQQVAQQELQQEGPLQLKIQQASLSCYR